MSAIHPASLLSVGADPIGRPKKRVRFSNPAVQRATRRNAPEINAKLHKRLGSVGTNIGTHHLCAQQLHACAASIKALATCVSITGTPVISRMAIHACCRSTPCSSVTITCCALCIDRADQRHHDDRTGDRDQRGGEFQEWGSLCPNHCFVQPVLLRFSLPALTDIADRHEQ